MEEIKIDASFLLALGGLATAIFAFITSRRVDKRAAKKDEVTLLRDEVSRLHKEVEDANTENEKWRKKYDKLYGYVLKLRKVLIDNMLDVPEMPVFDDNGDVLNGEEPKKKTKKE